MRLLQKSVAALAALVTLGVQSAHADTKMATAFGAWGFDLTGENPAIRPGDDFFHHANGVYLQHLQIPPDRRSWGTFNILGDLSQQRVRGIVEEMAAKVESAPHGEEAKIGAFYKAFMDEAEVEKRNLEPLQSDLADVSNVKTRRDFATLMGRGTIGFLPAIFDLSISPDAKDPEKYSIYLGQGGLGLPDRDYYLDPKFADKKAKYVAFVEQLLGFIGWTAPHNAALAIVAFEEQIAKDSWTRADRRDADKTYNPITLAELKTASPAFDWDAFFTAAELPRVDRLILEENTAVKAIAKTVAAAPLDTLKAWAAFHLAAGAANYLPARFVNADFEFNNKTLSGQPEIQPRWKRGVETVDGNMGFAIGKAYVARFFPPEAKAKMDVLTKDLRRAFRVRLEKLDWMTPVTKEKALRKLDGFAFQVGYPKKWRDYSSLDIRSDDLYGDVERSVAFTWHYWLAHLGKPVDRDEWEMAPQTVNAYNEPLFNEVVFPAAILQPPFFNPNADPAINYGGIGGVIGHEMTHSFDDQGRKFDEHGRLHPWWTEEDIKRFNARAARLGAQFSAMEPFPGSHINGDLTMGENIADLGGLTLALDAYHASLNGKPAPVLNGVTGDQRVFLGWAQVWRMKVREDTARQQLVVDPHSPPMARVNGPSHNIDVWYDAFDVHPGDKLYLTPANRVKIW